jgi:predicted nuclease of restriction endonuclease-like (RecB) superfamily
MGVTTYISLFSKIKVRIREAQVKATLAANAQMIAMYWDIGKMIGERQNAEGWSARIISKLSIHLKNELPNLKGFSERNLSYMLRFANEYSILQQPVAKL